MDFGRWGRKGRQFLDAVTFVHMFLEAGAQKSRFSRSIVFQFMTYIDMNRIGVM
jgi:hypothetical protein